MKQTGQLQGERRKVLIVANPFSGIGKNEERVERLVIALKSRNLLPIVSWIPAVNASEISNPDLRCVIVAGGDGTVQRVINEMPQAPVANYPLGNENLFGQEFGFTGEPEPLAAAIALGQYGAIDLGVANGKRFSLMVSAGFDAAVVHRVSDWRASGKELLRRANNLSYIVPILHTLRKYAYEPLHIQIDDGLVLPAAHVFVCNMARYGGDLPIAPDARYDDGLLDWVILGKRGFRNLLKYGLTIMTKTPSRGIRRGRAKRIKITSGAPVPVQADGDPLQFTPVDIAVQPESLKVILMHEKSGKSA